MKVYHYYFYPPTKRLGGPATYLHNIKEYAHIGESEILHEILFDPSLSTPIAGKIQEPSRFGFKRWFKRNFSTLFANLKVMMFLLRFSKNVNHISGAKDADIIHFHDAFDLVSHLKALGLLKCKIVLTSHCPKARHVEYLEDELGTNRASILKLLLRRLERLETEAYNRADALIAPCQEALEPYFNTWPGFSNVIKGKKIYSCPTGTLQVQLDPSLVKDVQIAVPVFNEKFTICFAGRHNRIKGYDLLKKYSEKLLNEFPDMAVVVLGKGGPIEQLQHDRWVEIGWTSTPHEYIHNADLFVLPNRETFFDLVLLEVMSIGKDMLLSRTGGNKYFEKNYEEPGFSFFDINSYDSFRNEIVLAYTDWHAKSKSDSGVNQQLLEIFDRDFRVSKMVDRLNNTYTEILLNDKGPQLKKLKANHLHSI